MNYTKGPWKYGVDPCTKELPKNHFYIHADGGYSGDYDHSGLQNIRIATAYTTNEANARLIAAAPDLLEALKMLLDRLDYHGNIDMIREEGPINDARAAISKAEGGA